MKKIFMIFAVLFLGCGLQLIAKTTIHNGTPYPIKVNIITTAGLKNHLIEPVDPLSEKECMTGPADGVCITKYQVWVKESGMKDYDEDHPNMDEGKLSDCGFHKHLIVTATKDKDNGNFAYHFSHAAMAAGKMGVHLHNGTDSLIKVEISGPGIPKAKRNYELDPGEYKTVLGGQFAGYVIRNYKVWVMPFGADKYNEKPDSEIKGYWDGFNKQLLVLQNTSLDGALTYKFKAERYL